MKFCVFVAHRLLAISIEIQVRVAEIAVIGMQRCHCHTHTFYINNPLQQLGYDRNGPDPTRPDLTFTFVRFSLLVIISNRKVDC